MNEFTLSDDIDLATLNARGLGSLPGWFGFEAVALVPGRLSARQIWQLTTQALARAVSSGRHSLSQQDFPRWLFDQTEGPQAPVTYLH